jgi:peptidoglycan hydrolase-like protein with peptidoglycan-binding domain
MSNFVDINGCPVPVEMAGAVRKVIVSTGYAPISVYRGDDPNGVAILRRHGKRSQRQLWNDYWSGRRGGILGRPAPPGTSTHEERSDGRAYRGPIGRRLAPWQCGMDWPNQAIPAVMRAFAAQGLAPIHPYAAGVEYHHINLTRPPILFVPLKVGSRGSRVWLLTHRLAVAGYLHHSGSFFSKNVTHAVMVFQRDHHLHADGVVGPVTWRNVEVAARRARAVNRRPLKVGSRGLRVWLMTHRLAVAGYLNHSGFFFSRHVGQVVKEFQGAHKLHTDGVVGPVTGRAITVAAVNARKRQH